MYGFASVSSRRPFMLRAKPYSVLARDYDCAMGLDHFRRVRALFEHLVRELGLHFSSAADVGCGTGLFARHLRRRWRVPVFAVDRSPAMLRVAKRNCCGTGVHLLQQDLRLLRLPIPVDLITANFDTVNHLVAREDLARALRCIADNLRPGGHFIFDFLTHCQGLAGSQPLLLRHRGVDGEAQQWIRWDPAPTVDRAPPRTRLHSRGNGPGAYQGWFDRSQGP